MGKMSAWGLEVTNIIKNKEIIWTRERQSKCFGYSEEEERPAAVGMKTVLF